MSLQIDRPKPIALVRKTRPEVISKIDALLETCTDAQIAEQINASGYTNWRGQSFTRKKVSVIRQVYHLKSRFERLRARGMFTAHELATQLGVCTASIYHWGRNGILHEHRYGSGRRCLYEPVGEVIVVKGSGGRYLSRPPRLINPLQSTTQGAI